MSRPSVWSAVDPLLARRCPTDIRRLVVSFIVDAVQGMTLRWSHADIGKEIREGFSPSLADSNTPASVSRVAGKRCLEAPSLHALPDPVLSRPGTLACVPVDGLCFLDEVQQQAAARSSVAAEQMSLSDDTLGSATTSASPVAMTPRLHCDYFADDGKAVEDLSVDVDTLRHTSYFITYKRLLGWIRRVAKFL